MLASCGIGFVAVALAACGGAPGAPHIASLGTTTTAASPHHAGAPESDSPTTTTDRPTGNATVLLDRWATCMRASGDPTQADPTIDSYGVIHVSIPDGAAETVSGQVHSGAGPCSQYLAAAQSALRAADPVAPAPGQSELIDYVNCMRANGVPAYPYPTGNTTNFNGTGVDPTSPSVEKANKLCGQKLDLPAWWVNGTGPPGDVVVTSGGPNGNGPSGGPDPNATLDPITSGRNG
ncbi:MAG TPA: hypothetical protein VL961_12460 [Acidimicrobiales bacterium]|nr:hypothetical protein [Acidimicrobiales bacterium]